jgi:hypothetical protein
LVVVGGSECSRVGVAEEKLRLVVVVERKRESRGLDVKREGERSWKGRKSLKVVEVMEKKKRERRKRIPVLRTKNASLACPPSRVVFCMRFPTALYAQRSVTR